MTIKTIKRLGLSLGLVALTLAVFWSILHRQPAHAQQGGIFVHKQLGRSNPVVYVGEYLTFTIHIRNDATFTITVLPLRDNYNASVLRFVDAVPVAPNEVDEAAAQLDWHDLTTHFGDLPPGAEVWLTVGFIAEHPATAIVNEARVHDAEGDQGAIGGGDSSVTDTVAIGGSAPVEKSLMAGLNPQIGEAITFTIAITNQGYVTLTYAALVDDYNPLWLEFFYADPPPDAVFTATGVLSWTDVTSWTGPIPPFQAVTITTVFTALTTSDDLALNRAEVIGAGDWYGNDLEGGADEVPITIIEGPAQPTPTPYPTPTPAQPGPGPAQPTPYPTVTPYVTLTATPVIPLLPATGELSGGWGWLIFAALLGLMTGSGAIIRSARRRSLRPEK